VTCEGEWAFDESGRPESAFLPGSSQRLRFEHDDASGRVHVRAEDGTLYATLGPVDALLASGVEERWELDGTGRPARFRVTERGGGSIVDLVYEYGDDGRIVRLGEWEVSYAGRHVARLARAGESVALAHDEAGNLLLREELGSRRSTHVTHDAGDRVQGLARGDGNVSYGHDAEGRRTERREDGSRIRYRYEAAGRLTEAAAGRRTFVRYGYDELGRRVRRESGGDVTLLHYDPRGNLVAETDEQGHARATYLWAGRRLLGRIDGPVGDPVAEWYHLDHRGTAWAVTGPDGAPLSIHEGDPLEPPACGPFQGKLRDPATGFYDFGCRDYDPETRSFTTPDPWTHGADDPRLAALGFPRAPHPDAARRNPYAFCLGDPLNNVDLDGHSAWWFFLTIPSSLTWALPNTVIALIIVFANLLMEIFGWVIYPFVSLGRGPDFGLTSYPWGLRAQTGSNPTNPFDLSDRAHIWFGMEASARLGVPWALLNGSFFVWRPYTLGNVIFAEDMNVAADEAEPNGRFVVPNDPDVQLNREDALWNHEMQHVFQYAYLGPLFHCLPLPPLVRLIENAIAHDELTSRDKWWEMIDLGGLTWAVGGLFFLMTGGKLKPDDFAKWVNPATWWREATLGNKVVDIAAHAIDFNNWLPGVGIYEFSSVWFTNQENSFFERNAGANSGDVYQTVVEVEEDKVFVGGFTRVVGADQAAKATPGNPTPTSTVAFTVDPPGGAAAAPPPATHSIDFDANNTLPVRVVNASGFYFQAFAPGKHTVGGTGSQSGATETVEIEVKDVAVTVDTDVPICASQTIAIAGDPGASYTLNLATNASGGSVTNLTYTAGPNAGTDTIEIRARYSATAAPFTKYGDNGLGGVDYVVKQIQITVREPVITPAAAECFVGGTVAFTVDIRGTSESSTANVAGSRFDRAGTRFIAGRGPIVADTVETVTFEYGCRQFQFPITVRPIVATATPNPVDEGAQSQINVTGGTPPYRFTITTRGSLDASLDTATGLYTAGATNTQVVDTVTVVDRNGGGGRARVDIIVRPV
jgi:RHS repeat-associated protein